MSPTPSPDDDSLQEMLCRALRGDLTDDDIQLLEQLAVSLEHLCDSMEGMIALIAKGEIDVSDPEDGSSQGAREEKKTGRSGARYAAAGRPFGSSRRARGIWRLFRQATTVN